MSTGISISSINRIKELAEEKKFAEALEILDTQNLDMSINPQFLRISGEIFRENKRYYDARRILIKAHEMAPQGTRIIAELIELHLELGHYSIAEKYYEQYRFYSTEEDTQRDYIEYIMKKASGTPVEELALILIPILETIPDDKWSFEAVLLYDKLGRKDKALEEGQYILENFKDSLYIKQIIEYIDDELDVDECFYIYPKEEIPDDKEIYKDLIEKEHKVLESDHLRMYPPEARIMVQADDKEADELRPVKEKKPKKRKKKSKSGKEEQQDLSELKDTSSDTNKASDDGNDSAGKEVSASDAVSGKAGENAEVGDKGVDTTEQDDHLEEEKRLAEEENRKKQEREAALERILSKKLDKDAIKESARQIAQSVNVDSDKAITQVKSVRDSVKNNVKKATDTIGGAVGVSEDKLKLQQDNSSEEIMDGIIESVLEPPKKSVGQVVTNEELDALIPDSLEAMSADEVADIEARKEEQERAELEALEASLRLEEEKKNKRKKTDGDKDEDDSSKTNDLDLSDIVKKDTPIPKEKIATVSFAELKARFLENQASGDEDEEPLDSLGFITVVQSDVDKNIEGDIPEAADILHRMIGNKEFYSGEDSRGFESKASYDRHDFEVEDYSFSEYIDDDFEEEHFVSDADNVYKVEDIFADESLLIFDDMIPEDMVGIEHEDGKSVIEETEHLKGLDSWAEKSAEALEVMEKGESIEHVKAARDEDSIEHVKDAREEDPVEHEQASEEGDSIEHVKAARDEESIEHVKAVEEEESIEHVKAVEDETTSEEEHETYVEPTNLMKEEGLRDSAVREEPVISVEPSDLIEEEILEESAVWKEPDKDVVHDTDSTDGSYSSKDMDDEPVVRVIYDEEELGWHKPFKPQYSAEEDNEENHFDAEDIEGNSGILKERLDGMKKYSGDANEYVNVTEEHTDATDEYVDVTGEHTDVADEYVEVTEERTDVADEYVDVTEERTDVADEYVDVTEEKLDNDSNRDMLRFRIIITDSMINSLSELKESR